jgi:hypothetical protein
MPTTSVGMAPKIGMFLNRLLDQAFKPQADNYRPIKTIAISLLKNSDQ